VIVDPVTARWALALYTLARRKGALAQVARDVDALSAEVARPATRAILVNPRVEREARRARLAPALASAHPLLQDFVDLLVDRGRERVLLHLHGAFRRLALEEQGAVEGVVESARPLEPATLERLATAVGARLGKQVRLVPRLEPRLLGGARVVAANRMLDLSVQGRLEALRGRLMDVRLPSAR